MSGRHRGRMPPNPGDYPPQLRTSAQRAPQRQPVVHPTTPSSSQSRPRGPSPSSTGGQASSELPVARVFGQLSIHDSQQRRNRRGGGIFSSMFGKTVGKVHVANGDVGHQSLLSDSVRSNITAKVNIKDASFTVLIDTGSSNMFLFAPDCEYKYIGIDDDVTVHPTGTYKPSNAVGDTPVPLGVGGNVLAAHPTEDDVWFAEGRVEDQFLYVIKKVFQPVGGSGFPADLHGFMGMGPNDPAYWKEPYWYRLGLAAGAAMFGIYMQYGSGAAGSNQSECGQISIGGVNPSLLKGEDPYWFPTVGSILNDWREWNVPLTGIAIQQNNQVSVVQPGVVERRFALFDTGATYIQGPSEDVKELYQSFFPNAKIEEKTSGGFTQFILPGPCTEVSFVFGNRAFPIKADDVWHSENGKVYGSILGIPRKGRKRGSDKRRWVMGIPFHQNWYTIYSQKDGIRRIGLCALQDRLFPKTGMFPGPPRPSFAALPG